MFILFRSKIILNMHVVATEEMENSSFNPFPLDDVEPKSSNPYEMGLASPSAEELNAFNPFPSKYFLPFKTFDNCEICLILLLVFLIVMLINFATPWAHLL